MDKDKSDVVQELHSDPARKKYKNHSANIAIIWQSFEKSQREQCLKAGAADGVVLQHRLDRSPGNMYVLTNSYQS